MELQIRLRRARKEISRRKGRWMWATQHGCIGTASYYAVLGWQFVTDERLAASKIHKDKNGLYTTYREERKERFTQPSKEETDKFWMDFAPPISSINLGSTVTPK